MRNVTEIVAGCQKLIFEFELSIEVCTVCIGNLIVFQGVIFSLGLNEDLSRLVSVSDDRTIRLWNLPLDWRTLEGWVAKCNRLPFRSFMFYSVLFLHPSMAWE